MKKRRNKFFDIRVQFFFICMAGFIGVALLAALAAWGLEHLGVNVPMFVWLLIFTLLLGSATAAGFSIAFFAPISRLSRAMKEVAGGNFRVHVETKSVFRDIRDSFDSFNLMVSELNATETLQTDFISNVSHEFKTPISAIEGYASLLQEHQQSPEEQAEYIDKILFNTRRLSALAGNILLLSKLDSQSIHPQRSRFRLDEQVRQCILALERKWTEKDVDFDVDLDSVDFTGYEGLLQHVSLMMFFVTLKSCPRGGLILTNNPVIAKRINSAVFPGTQGGPLEHVIAAKAVCFGEALKPEFKDYARKIVENAQALAAALQQRGVKLVSGGTDNHLMLIDLRDEECTGKDLEQRLDSVHITANKNTVPGETRSPFVTSGVRLGTPAVTTRGMGAAEMQVIADCIADCIWHYEEKKDEISNRVLRLTREFPLYQ